VASTKKKGDLAELRVACDLVAKGYRVAIPFGEDSDYDLVVDREGNLERVQVKYASSATGVIQVRCGSHSLTNGKVKRTKRYTAGSIDWLAVYDPEGGRCYYVPAHLLGPNGRTYFSLRVAPTRNCQRTGIHYAHDYEELRDDVRLMEPAGFEPATFRMQTERSPN
jgi:PD-(D/E)XK nuclease superfamily protein